MMSVSDERCLLTLSIEGNLSIALSSSPFMHLSILRSEARSEPTTKTENPCKNGPWRRWRRWTRTPHSNLPGDERQQGDDDGSLFLIPGTSGIFFSVFRALNKNSSPELRAWAVGTGNPHLFPEIVGSRSSEGGSSGVVNPNLSEHVPFPIAKRRRQPITKKKPAIAAENLA
jgi:hypothetical protein